MNQVEVVFNYKGVEHVIQCNENDNIKDIFNKFITTCSISQPNKFICTYNESKLNLDSGLSFSEIANDTDKSEKKINILVVSSENADSNDSFMVSKDIICPICKEFCQFTLNKYKITFFGCENDHMKENISLKEFEEGQKINFSKIICEKCNKNKKSNTDKNKFFYCFDCKINLCPLCKSEHEKTEHDIVDGELKNHQCFHKNKFFAKFCKTCKKNICIDCEIDHEKHETINFDNIKPENEELKIKLEEEKKLLDSFNDTYIQITQILKELKDNFEICYNIKKRLVDNYCSSRRHYQALMNLKEMNKNNTMLNDLKTIVNENLLGDKFNNILNTFNNMTFSSNQKLDNSNENELKKSMNKDKELKKLNMEIKKENNDSGVEMENQDISIKTFEKIKDKLEKDNIVLKNLNQELIKELKQLKNSLILKDIEISRLNGENVINKFLYKKNLIGNESLNNQIKSSNNLENNRNKANLNEINKLNDRIKELKNQLKEKKENEDNNNINDLMQKLSLIESIINYGVNKNTRIDSYNSPANKCLLIDLVLSAYPNYLENKYINYIQSSKVALAMLEIDRSDFAPTNPYQNTPQSINYNVTISAPHMHAIALEYLAPYCTENAKILDVGSGSAYLTCALSALTNYKGTVIGVEHITQLIDFGIKNVRKNHGDLLNNKKIIFVNGDGRQGCKEYGPYKAIHVGAAVEEVPVALFNQLDKNGRMFIPVGKKGNQKICIFDKDRFGKITRQDLLSVNYVLLTDVDSQLNPKY